MMKAFFFRVSSLNADVRSTRTPSSSLAMFAPFFATSPLSTRHYIASKQSGQADTSSRGSAPKTALRLALPEGLVASVQRCSGCQALRAGTLRCLRFRPLRGPGWLDHKGDDRAAYHDRRDDVEGEGVAVCCVYHTGDQ